MIEGSILPHSNINTYAGCAKRCDDNSTGAEICMSFDWRPQATTQSCRMAFKRAGRPPAPGVERYHCVTTDLCRKVDCGAHGSCTDGVCECNDTHSGDRCQTLNVWGDWSEYGMCSVSCGGEGVQERARECDQGECKGEDTQTQACNMGACATWSDWGVYGA